MWVLSFECGDGAWDQTNCVQRVPSLSGWGWGFGLQHLYNCGGAKPASGCKRDYNSQKVGLIPTFTAYWPRWLHCHTAIAIRKLSRMWSLRLLLAYLIRTISARTCYYSALFSYWLEFDRNWIQKKFDAALSKQRYLYFNTWHWLQNLSWSLLYIT